MPVSVNVSATGVGRAGSCEALERQISCYAVSPSLPGLECLERESFLTTPGAISAPERLKRQGITVSPDDFGVGYSGTACLTSLPPDAVKLNRSVVAAVSGSRECRDRLQHTIRVIKIHGYRIISGGVESSAMLPVLDDMGCDAVQGYVYSGRSGLKTLSAGCQNGGINRNKRVVKNFKERGPMTANTNKYIAVAFTLLLGGFTLTGCQNNIKKRPLPPAAQLSGTGSSSADASEPNKITLCQRELASLKQVNPRAYAVKQASFNGLVNNAGVYGAVRGDVNVATRETIDALYKYKTNLLCAEIEREVLQGLIRTGENVK